MDYKQWYTAGPPGSVGLGGSGGTARLVEAGYVQVTWTLKTG